ncbi:MAG: type VI secretion system tip protein VgrG [Betaproteobacteria bacterium]|nr:type VI secretion system tip protein VgrG [Betaproteobacteria bacterium]
MANSPAIDGGGVVRLTLLSNGSALPETTQIVSVSVRKSINKIPVAEIVVLDGDMPGKDFPLSNADYFKPGATIKINAGYGSQEDTIFDGIIVKHAIKITGNNFARLVIECRDKAVAMTIGRKNANFVDSKDSDIITKLIGTYSGLSSDVAATTTQYKELVQYYCTDWDFLLSRAEVNGLLTIVDQAKVSVKPPATDGAPALKVTYGDDLIEFHAGIDARTQFAKVQGVSWDMKTQAVVEQQAAPQTLNAQGNLDSAVLAQVIGLDSFRLQTPAALESAALKSWVDGQQLKTGLARIQGRMKFQGSAKAKVGELIELDGVGNRFNGKVFVSTIHHVVVDGNWITEAEFGMPHDWFAENRNLVAPPASGLLPGIEGLHIGVVKKLDADPDGQYKVQVSIPVLQAETDGVWARLTKFYASDGIGAFFIPEIGDEVVLGYFNNDPSNPVILGSLYSSKRKPPYELTADNFKKAIITRSKLKLEFDDDKKIITIITPGNNKIVISDEDKSILLMDQNNNQAKLSPDGILLDSPKDITITAKGKISISAVGNVAVDSKADITAGGMNITHTAKVGFTAKGNASAEISASGQTTVKGSMVMIN